MTGARRPSRLWLEPINLYLFNQKDFAMTRMTLSVAALCAALAAGIAGSATAHGYKAGPIEVEHPWARATAGSVPNGAAYLVLTDHGSAPDRLVSASSPAAERAELHMHMMDNGVMKMRPVDAIEVTPGSSTTLAPGGLHIMLFGLREPLVKGKAFPLTLVFEKAGAVTVEVDVQGAGAATPAHEPPPKH